MEKLVTNSRTPSPVISSIQLMDSLADGRISSEEEGVILEEKPDNLVWIENIIASNLDPAILHPPEESTNDNERTVDRKLLIAEIEMRDENYFGDDSRLPSLSRILGCRIKYLIEGDDDDHNTFWIIKVPPIVQQDRDIARVFEVARREISFYNQVLPLMRSWVEEQGLDEQLEFHVAACYYAKYSRPNDDIPDMELIDHITEAESIIVLEDLRTNEFGKRYFGKGMEISEVMAAVTEICKFHAVSYAMQKKPVDILGWGELIHWSHFVKLYEQTFKASFPIFEDFMKNEKRVRGDVDVDFEPILRTMSDLNENIGKTLTRLVKPDVNFPLTLVHMDLWSDNIMFRVRDEDANVPLEDADLDCFILDWQMISLGKPTHDIALLVILSMDGDKRREYVIDVLKVYYQLFEHTVGLFGLEMPFTYEKLLEEFSSSCLLAVLMAISSMDLILMEESTKERLLEAITDLVEDGLLPT